MLDRLFLRRLKRELPRWAERGWVDAAGEAAILDDVASRAGGGASLPTVVGAIGAVLLATGVILFVAANWQGMTRLAKVGLLFAGLWGLHGAAFLALGRWAMPRLGEVLLLAATLLFGANILLVAQIYHLPAEGGAALLLWSLGALAATWLVPGPLVAVAGLALAALWSILEVTDGGAVVHWPFLPLWAAFLPVVWRRRWGAVAHAALLALVAWGVVTVAAALGHGLDNALHVAGAAALALYAAGLALPPRLAAAAQAPLLRGYALWAALTTVSLLAVADIAEDLRPDPAGLDPVRFWLPPVLLLTLTAGLMTLASRRRDRAGRPAATAGMAAVVVLLAAITLTDGAVFASLIVLLNLTVMAGLIGLIALGSLREDRFLVNTGFAFFAANLLRLYFDAAWRLFDRSLFFMAGGLVVLMLGWALERQRRRLLGRWGRPA